MRGYDVDEYDDYDDYEEEGSAPDDEYEEEEEEEPKPTAEELKYLELRQKLKESYRKKMQKEASGSQDKKKTPDNFGSFFGPSKPVIAQRVIQETKPLLENQHLAARALSQNNSKKISSAPSGSKPAARPQAPRVSALKRKVEAMKSTRDYSFLLSEDAEPPAAAKKPLPQSVSTPRTEARSAKLPLQSKQTSVANGRQMSKGPEERRQVSSNGHMSSRAGLNKLPSSSKQNNISAANMKQLNSNGGSGPGRPAMTNGLQSRKPVASVQKPSLPIGKGAVSASMKPPAAKMQSVASRYQVEQRKDLRESNRADQRRDPRDANRFEQRRDSREPNRGEPRRDPRELNRGEPRRDQREPYRGEPTRDPREPNRGELRRDQREPNRGEQRWDLREPSRGEQRRDLREPNRGEQRRDLREPNRGELRRDLREPNRAKILSKTPVSSAKPQIQSQMKKPQKPMSSRVSAHDQKPKKRPARPFSDDEDDGAMAISMIRKMFRYNPNKFAGRDEDDSDMEAGFDDIMREENRSARIAKKEDEEQLRLIEEEERRGRMRKLKKRKMG